MTKFQSHPSQWYQNSEGVTHEIERRNMRDHREVAGLFADVFYMKQFLKNERPKEIKLIIFL